MWKDIEDYKGLYQVSNFGRVKSLSRQGTSGRILKGRKCKGGYLSIILCKDNECKFALVHRIVAKTFIKNPNNFPQVNHIDENKQNNKVSNLEWCTRKYNMNYGTVIQRREKSKKERKS